jgi:hypothetical protein
MGYGDNQMVARGFSRHEEPYAGNKKADRMQVAAASAHLWTA